MAKGETMKKVEDLFLNRKRRNIFGINYDEDIETDFSCNMFEKEKKGTELDCKKITISTATFGNDVIIQRVDIGTTELTKMMLDMQDEQLKKTLRKMGWVQLKNLYVEDGKIKELK